jgi:excisionase family DNA binding protein
LNVEQATAYIGAASRQRIYDLTSPRRIPAAKDGTRTLIHRAVLDAYLSGGDPWALARRLGFDHVASNGRGR